MRSHWQSWWETGSNSRALVESGSRNTHSPDPFRYARSRTGQLPPVLHFHNPGAANDLHGVFMEVFTIGVLITGDPGSGKSELALELLNRGHRLIADDAPEFTRISPEIIDGTCPEALQDCLEVRGLGVLNVRHMFGDAAVKLNKFLRLIIHLEIPDDPGSPDHKDRLRGNTSTMEVLELDIPRITLPVMAGRNLSIIAEAAVRDFMLKMKGFDAASEFIERHSRILQRQNRESTAEDEPLSTETGPGHRLVRWRQIDGFEGPGRPGLLLRGQSARSAVCKEFAQQIKPTRTGIPGLRWVWTPGLPEGPRRNPAVAG